MIFFALLGIVLVIVASGPKQTSNAGHSTLYIRVTPYWMNIMPGDLTSSYTTITRSTEYESLDGNTLDVVGTFDIKIEVTSGNGAVSNTGTYNLLRDSAAEAKVDNNAWGGDVTVKITVSVNLEARKTFGYCVPYLESENEAKSAATQTVNKDTEVTKQYFNPLSYSKTFGHNIFQAQVNYYNNIIILFYPLRKTITYDLGGATLIHGSRTEEVLYYDDYDPPGLSYPGHSFDGYYYSQTGNDKLSSPMNKDHDHTIYCRWTPNIYTITLNKQSGSGGTSTIYLKYNTGWYSNSSASTSITSITRPTRYGYDFGGYYTSTGGTGTQIIDADGKIVSGKLTYIAANDTLYAKWTPKTNCVLYFNSNLPSGATASINPTQKNVTFNSTYGTLATGTRTGYTLEGWYTTSSCTTKVSTTTKVASESQTVYAKWKPNTYYVKFNGNGNTGGSMTNQTFTYDTGQNLTANAFEKTGYSFQGWATSASGEVVYSNGQNVKNLTSANGGTVNLYAVWKAISYTLTFDPNGQGGTVNPTTKSVTFDTTYGTLPTPTRAGYIFIGWYTDKSVGTQVLSTTTVKTASNHSLYAHWQDTWANHTESPSLRVPSNPNNASNPYIIDTPGKLAWLAMQAQTKNLSGYYEQTKNIELDDYIWLPIGTNTYSFTGYYDGKGYTIEGLHTAETTEVSNSTSVNSYVGLFGNTNGAKLNNIYIKGADIKGHTNIGGIVGYASGSTVLTSCGFSGTISAQANSGALIGNSASGVQITDCIVFSANVDKLNSGSATITNTIYVLNGKKGCSSGEFANWVFVSGMPYPVPKGLSWLAQGGEQATIEDIQNWVNS